MTSYQCGVKPSMHSIVLYMFYFLHGYILANPGSPSSVLILILLFNKAPTCDHTANVGVYAVTFLTGLAATTLESCDTKVQNNTNSA